MIKNCLALMSQSIPTGKSPRATPGEIFLSERILDNLFCVIPCPGSKTDGRIPGGRAKFFPKSIKLLLKLEKNPKKIKKTTRQCKFFNWRT